jgi:inner membrane protein
VIVVERDDGAGEYGLQPGTLSVAPSWLAPTACASHRFGASRSYRIVDGRLVLYEDVRQPLETLRALHDRDCGARAWLQFGRAPRLVDGQIVDLRFDRGGDNFTAMRLRAGPDAANCPPHLTRWEPPRADLLVP